MSSNTLPATYGTGHPNPSTSPTHVTGTQVTGTQVATSGHVTGSTQVAGQMAGTQIASTGAVSGTTTTVGHVTATGATTSAGHVTTTTSASLASTASPSTSLSNTLPTFSMTITVYDFDNKLVETYENVSIPINPPWKNDFECLHFLSQTCKALQFNSVYGVTPYFNVEPLYALEGAIYPEIAPMFKSCVGWDFKPTQKWVDINSSSRLTKIEQILGDLKTSQDKPKLALVGEFAKFCEVSDLKALSDRDFKTIRDKSVNISAQDLDLMNFKEHGHKGHLWTSQKLKSRDLNSRGLSKEGIKFLSDQGHLSDKGVKLLTDEETGSDLADNYVLIGGKYVHRGEFVSDSHVTKYQPSDSHVREYRPDSHVRSHQSGVHSDYIASPARLKSRDKYGIGDFESRDKYGLGYESGRFGRARFGRGSSECEFDDSDDFDDFDDSRDFDDSDDSRDYGYSRGSRDYGFSSSRRSRDRHYSRGSRFFSRPRSRCSEARISESPCRDIIIRSRL